MTYNLDFGRVSNVIPAHDDAVSTLTIVSKLGILISGSWDCSVKYEIFSSIIERHSLTHTYNSIEFGKDSTPVVAYRFACQTQWLPIYR